MWRKFITWLDGKVEATNKWWIPPIQNFAKRNPRAWRVFLLFLIAAPFGVLTFILINCALWPVAWIGGLLSA